MTKKHATKREQILDTAADVWGGVSPGERSLGLLSRACGMTKPGLYRYFSSKDAIVQALNGRLESAAKDNNARILALAARSPLPWEDIVDTAFSFLLANWRLIRLYLQEGFFADGGDIIDNRGFYRELETVSALDRRTWNWLFNSITMLVWNRRRDPDLLSMGFRRRVTDVLTGGNLTGEAELERVFAEVERNAAALPKDDSAADRIDASLFELIESKGIADISLKELAGKAGMGKSSLYNYYASKEDMLTHIFAGLRDRYLTGLREILGEFEGSAERLYAHTLHLSRFIATNPAVKVLITELRSRRTIDDVGGDEPEHPLELTGLFERAQAEGHLRADFLLPREQLRCLTFPLGMDYLHDGDGDCPEERARRIFRLFARGIESETHRAQARDTRKDFQGSTAT
jgi:AcrR family transcriptional regulator